VCGAGGAYLGLKFHGFGFSTGPVYGPGKGFQFLGIRSTGWGPYIGFISGLTSCSCEEVGWPCTGIIHHAGTDTPKCPSNGRKAAR